MPWVGAVELVMVRPVPRSLVRTEAPLSATLAEVEPLSATAVGVTIRATVAVVVCPIVSVAVYVNESGPEYPAPGV